MKTYLVKHALKNVWCSPQQDRQAILDMSRMTPIGGSRSHINYAWEDIPLPTTDGDYHVYQIGNNYFQQLNLTKDIGRWTSVKELCHRQNQIIDVFLIDGRQYPKSTTYIYRTVDRNYLIATLIHPLIDMLDAQNLLLRLYSNAYFDSPRSTEPEKVVIGGGKMVSGNDIINTITAYNTYRAKGFTYLFHNGEYRDNISVQTVKVGDILEFVYDASIYRIVDFPLSGLVTFESILDEVRKYIIHPNKSGNAPSIQYNDDIDIFLYKESSGVRRGVYYHRYREDAVRNITHADYAVPVGNIDTFVNNHKYWENSTGLVLRVQMRRSGYDRPLVYEHHRIHELYKLTDAQIMGSLTGAHALVPWWRAEQLENSAYTEIMRAAWEDVTIDRVLDAYGYNATAKLIGDTPQVLQLVGADKFAVLPIGLTSNSTIYEFDADGYLLGWYTHFHGERHYARHPDAASIEVISGLGGKEQDIRIGNTPVTLNRDSGYRLYYCQVIDGEPNHEWFEVDPTDTTHVIIVNGVVSWTHNPLKWMGCVKQDGRFLATSYEIPTNYDIYRFSLTHTDIAGIVMSVPPGRIDVWINKHRLIKDIDYYIDYPQIVIVTKEYLVPGEMQLIDIRAYGFARPDMMLEENKQVGFVENGVLSYNGTYDLRDDRVIQITLDGASFGRDDVVFSEDTTGVRVPSEYEGKPYEVSDIVVPIRGVEDYHTYLLRERSKEVDTAVGDYLSMLLPEPVYPDRPEINDRYRVFSPFLNRVISAVRDGSLIVPTTIMTDRQVMELPTDYRWILEYDPCVVGVMSDQYIMIHPTTKWTPLAVKQHEYSFLERLVSLSLFGKVDLTPFLIIEE